MIEIIVNEHESTIIIITMANAHPKIADIVIEFRTTKAMHNSIGLRTIADLVLRRPVDMITTKTKDSWKRRFLELPVHHCAGKLMKMVPILEHIMILNGTSGMTAIDFIRQLSCTPMVIAAIEGTMVSLGVDDVILAVVAAGVTTHPIATNTAVRGDPRIMKLSYMLTATIVIAFILMTTPDTAIRVKHLHNVEPIFLTMVVFIGVAGATVEVTGTVPLTKAVVTRVANPAWLTVGKMISLITTIVKVIAAAIDNEQWTMSTYFQLKIS